MLQYKRHEKMILLLALVGLHCLTVVVLYYVRIYGKIDAEGVFVDVEPMALWKYQLVLNIAACIICVIAFSLSKRPLFCGISYLVVMSVLSMLTMYVVMSMTVGDFPWYILLR